MEQRESHEMHSVSEETRQANASAPKVPETTHEPMYTSRLSRASSMTVREPIVRTLHTSFWPLMVFIFYATLALFTWIVLCVASSRPIGSKLSYTDNQDYFKDVARLLAKHERILRAAQILQSVVALLTIPITSAICSIAFAAYIQAGSSRTKLNLRQTMALADQGWISPRMWARWSKVGSLPLYFAFALTLVVVRLRSILESRAEREHEPYLWIDEQKDGLDNDMCYDTFSVATNCNRFSRSLYQLDEMSLDAWFSPVPLDFSTGVYVDPQYAPRLNTTIEYRNMTDAEWPTECVRDREDVFFAQYRGGETGYREFDIIACIPANISGTPWQATYNQQDITEDLFLAISVPSMLRTPIMWKITARSTLGYFELPNTKNGNRAGPLLHKLSLDSARGSSTSGSSRDEKRATNETYAGNVRQPIGNHIGPLTAIGLALFGEGSFIERRVSNPSAFLVDRPEVDDEVWFRNFGNNCLGNMPLNFAIGGPCLRDYDYQSEVDVLGRVRQLAAFFDSERSASRAFTVAAFLANKEWLNPSQFHRWGGFDQSRNVYVDTGVPTKKTYIALWGVITGSVFLGLHLLGLLVLALYAFWMRPFTPWLGAEFVVKAGTAHADILSAAEGDKQWKQTVSACPGFVGDEKPTDDVGRIAFGATAALSTARDKKFEEL
ncbi:uncharacterized protein J4E79_005469 [Alternaria viburni]|uniref:uncharacterized protein n=1 Tax=Alternaria viburni TaxID=566460 RepID=UPI0020C3BD2F|nr:uncharacterized protein J4E79_005469 [Alternaria viburni]KAI4660901.1 hypothetical protein J4E79_005469 [Alternaria viburni]